MLIGLPGTGKTILAQQYLFANATIERPALPRHGVGAVRQDPPLRPEPPLLRPWSGRQLGLLRGPRPGSQRARPRRRPRAGDCADQGAPPGNHRDRQLQGTLCLRGGRRVSAASSTNSPATCPPSRPRRFGSASTAKRRSPWHPNSRSPTPSSASPRRERPSARRVPSASSSCGEANSLPASTPTASRRTGSTSSRGWPTRST